jgi:hypothetical protein
MRREDYSKAFPPEETKTVKLKPAGLERETFNIEFKDIIGGREYLIKAVAKDVADSANFEERKTHCIREFENIGALNDTLVGAFYYEWYDRNDPWFQLWWNELGRWYSFGYPSAPLFGQYDSTSDILVARHIDIVTGHGINYFLVHWGSGPGMFDDQVLREKILKNPLISQIKFCILYESGQRLIRQGTEEQLISLTDSQNVERLIKDFGYLSEAFFDHPSYLTRNGKKVVFFDASRFFTGNVSDTIERLRESVGKHLLYLICDALGNFLPPSNVRMVTLLKTFDAVSADDMWVNNYNDPSAQRNFVYYTDETLKAWRISADKYGCEMVPSVNPGWEPYLYRIWFQNFSAPFLTRNQERYSQLLQIAKKHNTGHMIVGHFNEWFVHSHLEPDTKDGFNYLQALRNSLA